MKVVIASWDGYTRWRVIVDEPIGKIFTLIHPEHWLNDDDGNRKYLGRPHPMEGKYFRFDKVSNFEIHEK